MTRRSAIVTGASSGIGAATAVEFARRGFDVGIIYQTNTVGADRTEQAVRHLGRNVLAVQADLGRSAEASAAVATLAAELENVSVLVNNAGINRRRALLDEDADGWRRTFDVNVAGPMLCAQTMARHWVTSGSLAELENRVIVNVTSVLDRVPLTGGAAYCSSKAALRSLTQVIALELASYGIRVVGLAPGETITPMNFEKIPTGGGPVGRPVIPLGMAVPAPTVARAIVAIASSDFTYMTGETVLVDGGLSLVSGPDEMQRVLGEPPSA